MSEEQKAPKPTDIKPPFTMETAQAKVKAAENAWNSRDPERIALGLQRRFRMAKSNGFYQGARGNQGVFKSEMGKRT